MKLSDVINGSVAKDKRIVYVTDKMLSVLRFMAGLLFWEHGTMKILGIPDSHQAAINFASLNGVGSLLEFVGGFLLVLGLFTRVTAFILSGEMAVAYFVAHAPKSFYPIVSGGELAALYCFTFLFLAVAGGGPWSLDRWMRRVP